MNTLITAIIATAIISFILGYKYCYLRNCVDDTKTTLDIFVELTAGRITNEEAKARLDKIISKYGK